MNNSTNALRMHFHRALSGTLPSETIDQPYDSTGAILYIIFVLFWYSMGIVCMLAMQIKARDETIEDCARRRARLLLATLGNQTHTKQILGKRSLDWSRSSADFLFRGTGRQRKTRSIVGHLSGCKRQHECQWKIAPCGIRSYSKHWKAIGNDQSNSSGSPWESSDHWWLRFRFPIDSDVRKSNSCSSSFVIRPTNHRTLEVSRWTVQNARATAMDHPEAADSSPLSTTPGEIITRREVDQHSELTLNVESPI